MADNITLNSGSGGDTLAADDDGAAKWPYSKIAFGADNTQTIVTSITTNPFPVALSAVDNAVLDTINTAVVATQAAVEGTLTVGSHAVTNAGTFVTQLDGTGLTRLTDIETNTNYGAVVGGGLEATALRVTLASDSTGVVTVDGTVTANPASGTIDVVTSLTQMGGVAISLGTGTRDGGCQRITIATDDSLPVTNAGTFVTQLDGTGLTRLTDIETNTDSLAVVGGGTEAAAVRVTLANDSTGVLNTVTTVATVSRVNRLIPGTTGADLGKAIDSPAGATDTGVAMLAKHQGDTDHLTSATDDYDVIRMSEWGGVHVEPEQHHVIDQMDALTANGGTWAAIDSDTTGVALSTKHVLGSGSIEFDKVDGLANSGIGGITKALTAVNLGGLSPHDIIQTVVQVGATTELDGGSAFFFLRLGTDSTDYNEWRIDGTEFTAGIWETVALEIGDASFSGQGGVGWNPAVITYIAVGFSFDAVGDALANIYVDEISFHTNQHVNAAINAEITSSVSSANINVNKWAGSPATKGAGAVGAGTQRMTLASDDPAVTSLAILDDWDETNRAAVNPISGQAGIAGGTGVDGVTVTRVSLATDIALPTGANTIGVVDLGATDNTVLDNIDTATTATNAALLGGLTSPVVDSYVSVAINVAAGATDAVLVAAPGANKQIWVYGIEFSCNVAGTVSIQDSADLAITGVVNYAATGGMARNPSGNFAMPTYKLGSNLALEMDTVTCEVDGDLTYAIVDVS